MKHFVTFCLIFFAFLSIVPSVNAQGYGHEVHKLSPVSRAIAPIPFLFPRHENPLSGTFDQISYFDTTSGLINASMPFSADDTTAYVGYGERFTESTLTNFTVDSVEFVIDPIVFDSRPANEILVTVHKRGPDFPPAPLVGAPYAQFPYIDSARLLSSDPSITIGTPMDMRMPFAKKIKTKFTKTSPDFWIYVQLGPDTTGDDVSLLMDATTDDPANHDTQGNTLPLPDGDRGYVWGTTPSEVFQGILGGRFQDQNGSILYNQLLMVAYVSGTSLGVDDVKLEGNALAQNYPNPFNPSTQIKYSLENESLVSLKVYNTLGVEVATIVNDNEAPGEHVVTFMGDNLPSGTYFYTLKAGTFSQTKRMVLSK